MHTVFLACAVAGGTILVLQVALSLLGFGLDHAHVGDVGGHAGGVGGHAAHVGCDHAGDPGDSPAHDHHGLWSLGRWLTFQTILAFVTFFGIGGLATFEAGRGPGWAVPVALGTGLAAMVLLGSLFHSLGRLQSDGSLRLAGAEGSRGRVYLRVPGGGDGEGKVTLAVQGRLAEVQARTPGPELRTGEEVAVTRVLDARTVEVVAASAFAEKPAPLYD